MNDITTNENTRTQSVGISIPRIRNMKRAYAEIIENDPYSSISFFSFRREVIKGSIPSMKNGKRYLVNMNDVEAYYS